MKYGAGLYAPFSQLFCKNNFGTFSELLGRAMFWQNVKSLRKLAQIEWLYTFPKNIKNIKDIDHFFLLNYYYSHPLYYILCGFTSLYLRGYRPHSAIGAPALNRTIHLGPPGIRTQAARLTLQQLPSVIHLSYTPEDDLQWPISLL